MNAIFATRSTVGMITGKGFEQASYDFARLAVSTLDILSAHICVIDRTGAILMVNRAWRDFCDQNCPEHPNYFLGSNYLEICDAATGQDSQGAAALVEGTRSVIDGERKTFVREYVCNSATGQRWFSVRVTNFIDGCDYAAVTHEDITEQKRSEEAQAALSNELRGLASHLETVKESERKRIARELHDELGQHLLSLKMDVAMLHARTASTHPRINDRLSLVLDCIDGTMKTVKSIINDLRPAALDLGLTAAIQAHARAFERRTGIACELVMTDGNIELDNDRMTTLFRVVQESLVNVARHAQASKVHIALRRNGGCVSLHVSDNGTGIVLDGHKRRGKFGLVGMRERINAHGGKFSIEQEAGGGTKLTASVPL